MIKACAETVVRRFLNYVTIDTQSDPHSGDFPSTQKQKNLGRLLVAELMEMGIADAHLDEYGYVYATIPSTSDKQLPVVCFCSHMDTSPDCSGAGVKPILHKNYQGEDLILPDDTSQIIRQSEHPDLAKQTGNDIITASGTTLLGADNKAGIAEIMDMAYFFMQHPEAKHGTIKVLFTPDEEIGCGADHVDLKKLGAAVAYTVDGETLGSIENETFSADGATLTIYGVSAHPGFARGKLESAIKIAAGVIDALPKDRLTPESTSGKQGFIHPVSISGSVEQAVIEFILRDFEDTALQQHAAYLEDVCRNVIRTYPHSTFTLTVKPQYRNMKQVLDDHPLVVEYGVKAIQRAGLKPILQSIRGGTDGSRLSFMGLPCPNLFAGEHAFHSRQEWVAVQDMEKAVETLIHLAMLWEEGS